MKENPDKLVSVHAEPSYRLKARCVEAFLTRRGGHLGPVRFRAGRRRVSPYSVAPWEPGECARGTPAILQILRGDFFCFPFGDDPDAPPVHGESANAVWQLREKSEARIVTELRLKKGGSIRKTVTLDGASPAIYQEHLISGVEGEYNFGHHAILQFPEKGGPFFVNVSPFHFGQVKPEPFTDPAIGEYSALRVGAGIRSLKRVRLATGGKTSLQEYPAREGFEDLAMVSSRVGDFAWTAATLDGYVWLQLKDPRVLPSTLFWFTNGGRHYPPWNGTHRHRLGLEEVCSHFNDGLSVSREKRLKRAGVPTVRRFRAGETTAIRLVQTVHPVEKDFGMVVRVSRRRGAVRIVSDRGKAALVPVEWERLFEGGGAADEKE